MQRRPYRRPNPRQSQKRYSKSSSYNKPSAKRYMDINCDIGQSFGNFHTPFEEQILPYVTSVNIACGMHMGDPTTIAKTIDLVKNQKVNIGALIGYPDRISNGQREMYYEVDELRALVLYQLGAINTLLHAKGIQITHVRTHGFLYKQMYTDQLVAETVAKAIGEFNKWITLIGLAGSVFTKACSAANIKMSQEIIIDRRYRQDGTILPFSKVTNKRNYIEDASQRARDFLQKGIINCEDGNKLIVNATTIHIPSDSEEAVELARMVWSMVPEPRALNTDKFKNYFADLAELKN